MDGLLQKMEHMTEIEYRDTQSKVDWVLPSTLQNTFVCEKPNKMIMNC